MNRGRQVRIGIIGALILGLPVVVLAHWYIWRRLFKATVQRRWFRRATAILIACLGLSVPAALATAPRIPVLAFVGYLWLALLLYLMIVLPLIQLVSWPIRRALIPSAPPEDKPKDETRRLVLARGGAIVAGLAVGSIVGYGMHTALGVPRLRRVRIGLDKLPAGMDGYRIALVSDIHLGPLSGRSRTERIVEIINATEPDIVAIVGDLVDGTVAELGRAAEPLSRLRSRQGSFFVTGNHEYFSGYLPWVAEVASFGVRPLRNERVALDRGAAILDLAGVNDATGAAHGDPADYGKALGDRDTDRPVVLLAHQPVQVREAARYHVDLQLSGHTHGGQMVPMNLVVAAVQPVVSGYARIDGTQVFVTNGAGFWGPPVRVGAPPDVTLVQLRTT